MCVLVCVIKALNNNNDNNSVYFQRVTHLAKKKVNPP